MKYTLWDWFIVVCLGAVLLGHVALSYAGNVVHKLGDGESVQFRCDGGTLTTETHTGSVAYWKCTKSGQPQPPDPEPQPPTQCAKPTYPVANSKPLRNAQEIITLAANRTVVRTFNSSQFTRGVNISWGPYSSGGPRGMSVSVSECPGDFDVTTLPRACFSGAATGQFFAGVGGSGCKLKPDTDYVVNLAPHFITNGRFSCPAGGACQLTFFSSPQ